MRCHEPTGNGNGFHGLVQSAGSNGLDLSFAVFSQYSC